jgi:hypothetical protein
MVVIGGATAGVLALLALLHVYWSLGGRRGWDAAIPEAPGAPMFQPGRFGAFFVALLLGSAAAIIGTHARALPLGLPVWFSAAGTWTIAVVFAGRVVGDFRLFGLFKKVRETRFARLDSWLYTPLCALLSAACVAVGLT